MKILAIDTSTVVASCAICEEDFVLATSKTATGLTHSQTLMVLVDDMFKAAKIAIEEIEAVAVSVGPGSFTGLRIGIAAAKGVAMGLKVPIVGVDTLHALSYNLLGFNSFVCPCIDARNDMVYTALFENSFFDCKRVVDDFVENTQKLKEILKEKDSKVFLVGDASKNCYLKFKDCKNILLAPANLRHANACSVGFIGITKIKNGSVGEVVPKYLRLSQAEQNRKKKTN